MYIKSLLDHYQINLILDVGANIGQFGTSMRRIGYRGEMISFEPISTEFEKLRAATRGDAKWQVCNFALGDECGTQNINVMSSSVFSSFHQPSVLQTSKFAEENSVQRTERVEIRTLVDVARERGFQESLSRTFLKCDTQGFDMKVLMGAGNALRTVRMLQVELSVAGLYDKATPMNDMLGFLDTAGFSPVSFFPIVRLPNWSAVEFDYLGVNRVSLQ